MNRKQISLAELRLERGLSQREFAKQINVSSETIGIEYYGVGKSVFERLAKDAGAIYKVNKVVLVNCELFERYLKSFHGE